jgi:hypothetical protein
MKSAAGGRNSGRPSMNSRALASFCVSGLAWATRARPAFGPQGPAAAV